METIKSWFRWVYDWITVLSATVIGVISQIDTSLLGGSDTAVKIITAIAVVKGVAAYIEKRRVAASK